MHQPEHWGYVQFSTAPPGQGEYRPDPAGQVRHLLMRVYHAQRAFHAEHERFAGSLEELGMAMLDLAILADPPLFRAGSNTFLISAPLLMKGGGVQRWHIREDSRAWAD
jgi:hypothetical protein